MIEKIEGGLGVKKRLEGWRVGGVPFEEMSVIKRKKKTVFLPPPHPPTYSCATSVHNSHNDDGT